MNIKFEISNFNKKDTPTTHIKFAESDQSNLSVIEIFEYVQNRYLYEDIYCEIPDKYLIKELGRWIYTNSIMKKIYISSEFYQKTLEWMVDDINSNYLANYYNLLKDYGSFIDFCDERLKREEFIDFDSIDLSDYRWSLYSLIVYPTYWQDDFQSNPIHWEWTENAMKVYFGFPAQLAKDPYHRAYFTQESIVELFHRYCPTWHFNEQKSKKKVYVFTRPCKSSNDYEWCIVVQIPKLYKASFQVVLSKKNTKKLNSKDIVFQCHFIIPSFDEFGDIDLLSSWKANAIFRYHYVERYLEYIEPLVFVCMNNE